MFKNTTKKVVNDAAEEIREEVKKDVENLTPYIEKIVLLTIFTLVAVRVLRGNKPPVINQIYILREQPDIQFMYRGRM